MTWTNGTNGADGAPGAGFGIFYLGNYNPNSGYVPDIAVVRGSDGQLYLAKASGQLGDPVGNTAQWEVWIPKGADGTNGTNGTNGADALWNFVGAYDGGTSYAIGDVATYGGQLWYRTHANGGTVGNTPSEGFIWALLAAKGADGSGGTADTGDITFDGVQIIGAGTASGDGYGLGTIELVPDGNITSDQYLIIDPTAPNHIHIRAGGVQDDSTADLFLGAERNNVRVSDPYNNVTINTRPDTLVNTYGNSNQASNTEFMVVSGTDIIVGDTVRLYTGGDTYTVTTVTPEYPYAGLMTVVADGLSFITGEAYTFTREQSPNLWTFEEDGVLYGPAMGGVKVLGLQNSGNNDLGLYANDADIYLQASSGAVTIAAPEVTITSNASPSSLNINTYSGAIVNSHRTSTYSAENKVVATLGDLPTGATGTFETSDSKLVTVTNGIITSIESLT